MSIIKLPSPPLSAGVAFINHNRQFGMLFTDPNNIEHIWKPMNTDQISKMALPDLFTEIACLTMMSGAAGEDGEEMQRPLDQDDEGTLATCFYQSNSQVVKVRWDGGWGTDTK
ncbi:hypothetical protein B0T21DRAFT_407971 [Apiosordaria backusii]|uniref:Uncharacterized protein n=1 Tax=Apiosordaria backusii TaxID=314023 RepID=A0AA40ESU2_9PEZI|nr:hypothetical protein B0T21DRAFT_407971 [Apiosordaria backusii]